MRNVVISWLNVQAEGSFYLLTKASRNTVSADVQASLATMSTNGMELGA